jgi:hypothetical protein
LPVARKRPSPNPLDLLSLWQLVVFLARAHERPLTELVDLLGLSRETVHLELRSAIRTLSARALKPRRGPRQLPAGPIGSQTTTVVVRLAAAP